MYMRRRGHVTRIKSMYGDEHAGETASMAPRMVGYDTHGQRHSPANEALIGIRHTRHAVTRDDTPHLILHGCHDARSTRGARRHHLHRGGAVHFRAACNMGARTRYWWSCSILQQMEPLIRWQFGRSCWKCQRGCRGFLTCVCSRTRA